MYMKKIIYIFILFSSHYLISQIYFDKVPVDKQLVPRDLTTNGGIGHYMLFYVNVQDKTKYIYEGADGETVGNKVEVVENLKDSYGKPSSGVFNPETNTIQLDRATGMNSHTVLHEMAHAVGSAELSNPKSAFTIRMTKLYNDAKGMLDTEYGAQDLQEFFAEAMANEGFRKKLARLHPDGTPKNVLQRFIENMQSLLNRLLGRTGYQSKGALKEFDSLVDHIIAPAPASRGGEILAMNADNKGAKESAETLDGIQKDLKKKQ